MNKQTNYTLNLEDFQQAINNENYETARKMLNGKYKNIFLAYQTIEKEIENLHQLKITNPQELEEICLTGNGLKLIANILELTTNNGIMLTKSTQEQGEKNEQ